MANNYYDATGILVLDRVTPVISALFGGFRLDASYPGKGQAYIAASSEWGDPLWDDVRDNLVALVAEHDRSLLPGVVDEEGDDSGQKPGMPAILDALVTWLAVENVADLLNLIEHQSFEDCADVDTLFLLATCFNDGHNLREIHLEGCWHCSKPRLFGFGGEGRFLSREIEAFSHSGRAIELGRGLRSELLQGHFDRAAALIAADVRKLLAGIADEEQRRQLQWHLAAILREGFAETSTGR
jgi:hypothetical protein